LTTKWSHTKRIEWPLKIVDISILFVHTIFFKVSQNEWIIKLEHMNVSYIIQIKMLVFLIWKLMEEFAIWVRQKLICIKSKTNWVILDPSLFIIFVWLLLQKITEFIICDNESIGPLCILNTVWVIVVLWRSFNYITFKSHIIQQRYIIWHLACLIFFYV